jgi:hypothetical protein
MCTYVDEIKPLLDSIIMQQAEAKDEISELKTSLYEDYKNEVGKILIINYWLIKK